MAKFIEINAFDESQVTTNRVGVDDETPWFTRTQVNLDLVAYIVPLYRRENTGQESSRRVMVEFVFVNGLRILEDLGSQPAGNFDTVTTTWDKFFESLMPGD